jgi:alanyl-tRNA synthetase
MSDRTRRVYLEDSGARNFTAEVEAVGEHAGKPAVLLRETCFYPEGGGQPADHGTIGPAQVVDVQDAAGEIWHVLDRPLEPGTYPAAVDDERRRDHMQQHSGQHLLSRCFENLIGVPTVSFHLGVDEVTIDLARDTVTYEDAVAAEALANQIVLENRPVTVETMTPDAAARAGVDVPAELAGDAMRPLRVISIAGFDRTACGGTHVGASGEIGPIEVRRTERTRGRSRITFLCGGRTLRDQAWRRDAMRALAARLQAGERDVPELVLGLLADKQSLADRVAELEAEAAKVRARELAAEAERVADFGLVLGMAGGLAEARALAKALAEMPGTIALVGALEAGKPRLVFAAAGGGPVDMGAVIRVAAGKIGGRGGGRPGWAEAGGEDAAELEAALEVAAAEVRRGLSRSA